MNPFAKFQDLIIGKALAYANDVFEKARIFVLFNFSVFFLVLNIPYMLHTFAEGNWLHITLAIMSTIGLGLVLVILSRSSKVKLAALFYLFNHLFQNLAHYCVNNGHIEAQGSLFFLLLVLFGYVMLGRKWGFSIAIFVATLLILGVLNENSGYLLFRFPPGYSETDQVSLHYMLIVPFMLNVYLVREFVKAHGKAEKQISDQKALLESKNEDIISSINYARRIQNAILPNDETVQRGIPNSFIFYQPRDIVSGDFYWFHENDDSYILVAADCTGHGVPGAFMTVIGSNLLTQIVSENEIREPAKIMTRLDDHITATLKQEKQHLGIVQDGMDLSLLKVDKIKKEFIFTSAKRPAIFIRNGEIREFKGSKSSLGGLKTGEKIFDETKLNYEAGDMIYLFTDGYIDQFGGSENKKFMIKRLREMLLQIWQLPMAEQEKKISEAINGWIGKHEQTDDILLIGIRF
ncbi:MAG: PP2C family protein-serine/threonine phosphatase [Bacteroidia bacterium]